MKKELLIASALTASLGAAGVAEAVNVSYSGNIRNGVAGSDLDSASTDGSYSHSVQTSLSWAVDETTDGGVKVSTGFTLLNEGSSASANASGLTLTFTDGSKLDVLKAGNAYATQIATVPGGGGEVGVTGTTANSAPTSLTFANTSDNVGFEWHSAADFFGVDGLKVGVSGAFGDDGDSGSTSTAENSYSVGVSYVTTAGDTTVTVGGGFVNADDSNGTTSNDKADQVAFAGTAKTGDLTVGVGYASGSMIKAASGTSTEVDNASITSAGVKYVSGDMTFNIGMLDSEAKDHTDFGSNGSNVDAYERVGASLDYVVVSGVTATLGYRDESASEEGTSDATHSGSSWYIGANVSF